MWLITLLPNWVFHTILIAGVLLLISSGVLLQGRVGIWYLLPVQAGAAFLIIVGAWFGGGIYNESIWLVKTAKLEAQIVKAEQDSAAANAAIIVNSKEKVQVIRAKQLVVKQFIDREIIKYDATCVIPAPVINVHNAAALNQELK